MTRRTSRSIVTIFIIFTIYIIDMGRRTRAKLGSPWHIGRKQQHIGETDLVTTASSDWGPLAGRKSRRQVVPTYGRYNILRSTIDKDDVRPSFSIVDLCALGDTPFFPFGKRGTDEGAHIAARTGIICILRFLARFGHLWCGSAASLPRLSKMAAQQRFGVEEHLWLGMNERTVWKTSRKCAHGPVGT